MRHRFAFFVFLLFATACVGCNPSSLASVHEGSTRVTLAHFSQIETGMTYEQVRTIIGGDCVVVSESGSAGTQMHIIMYGCDGDGQIGSNVSFMFQGGGLVNKTQIGLR